MRSSRQRNSTQSPLLRLPAELRNAIWSLALGGLGINLDVHRVQRENCCYTALVIKFGSISKKESRFELPRVCKQIYAEATPYINKHNLFIFRTLDAMHRWVVHQPHLEKITSIQILLGHKRIYNHNFRHGFRRVFPGLKLVRISVRKAYSSVRSELSTKKFVNAMVQEKGGDGVAVEWV
jgi:hypothetical protein